ncbi:MAG: aminotransferase class I/II-fold pyridoxal phosphate-dependent enzyme [Lachnospiraceae bacterium]|nr:aminotransferase class I/II-fold pyridoxal phosphate-dependent enzyme [Lachnospiraceae bacterium]
MLSFVHGGNIYDRRIDLDLSVSLNPLGMPEGLREILLSSASKATQYPEPFNRSLSKMAGEAFGIPMERIVFGNGASELILSFARCFAKKKALLPIPCFTGYIYAIKNACPDCEIIYYRLKEEEAFRLDRGIINVIKDEHPDILFLANPNNPNGALINSSLLSDIALTCEETGTNLVIDECFLPFTGKDESDSFLHRLSGKSNITVLRAFTKTFAIPGVRIGYAATSSDETADLMRKELPEWNMSTIAQEAAKYCLKNLSYETAANSLIIKERATVTKHLESEGYKVYPSDCNFVLFKTENNEDLFEQFLSKGVLIRDCANIPGLSKGYYRISIVDPRGWVLDPRDCPGGPKPQNMNWRE